MTLTLDKPERMPMVGGQDVIDTRYEQWMMKRTGWYGVACAYAAQQLGQGEGRKCLVIGSPIPEVEKLQAFGWKTTHVDIRRPPYPAGVFLCADATELPIPDELYDAVSSTCCLCHAGLGRYGDPIKPNGDELMMAEIARVLKPGGTVAMMAGPAVPDGELTTSLLYGNVHRIYRPVDVIEMASAVGFECLHWALATTREWVDQGEIDTFVTPNSDGTHRVDYCYLLVTLRKGDA